MKNVIAVSALVTLFSTNVFAKVETYPAASVCHEDVVKKNSAFEKHLAKEGNFEQAMKTLTLEKVGVADGRFMFAPSFGRTERQFVCNIPLNDDMGNVKVNMHAYLTGMKAGRPGGCEFSTLRRISDGTGWKIFDYAMPGGFAWTGLKSNGGFVDFSRFIDNEYRRSTSLKVTCRTTWDQGEVQLNHIELEY
ncbi:hypothetical protein [Vibrio neptunius]|uniref:Uncharacterized protein n=1 Tax=Vibrio neptunius TaxID=170651 RepID=A0ABS2ZZD9_9VIBR|nr:hypothetical protein [Vibrio neptunius]MBN3492820.1 hypothetical protein [Vibrio neptunius]MBN3515461.1 hypothetical protein [Vibrio neptunius]MBN3549353.1 hypothetical protein [Vibrio neptunius]MBN3577622.1 hypothetical protein [Vibrio neptunius]MCH9871286.1 hypothetical protein [Vibrio neptunius]